MIDSRRDRLFWVLLRQLWSDWAEALTIVNPTTVVGWHRAGFRLFWSWRPIQGYAALAAHRAKAGRRGYRDFAGALRVLFNVPGIQQLRRCQLLDLRAISTVDRLSLSVKATTEPRPGPAPSTSG